LCITRPFPYVPSYKLFLGNDISPSTPRHFIDFKHDPWFLTPSVLRIRFPGNSCRSCAQLYILTKVNGRAGDNLNKHVPLICISRLFMHKFLPLRIGLYIRALKSVYATHVLLDVAFTFLIRAIALPPCVSNIRALPPSPPSLFPSLSLFLSQDYIWCDIRWICLPCNRMPNPPLNVRSVVAFCDWVSCNRDCYELIGKCLKTYQKRRLVRRATLERASLKFCWLLLNLDNRTIKHCEIYGRCICKQCKLLRTLNLIGSKLRQHLEEESRCLSDVWCAIR